MVEGTPNESLRLFDVPCGQWEGEGEDQKWKSIGYSVRGGRENCLQSFSSPPPDKEAWAELQEEDLRQRPQIKRPGNKGPGLKNANESIISQKA